MGWSPEQSWDPVYTDDIGNSATKFLVQRLTAIVKASGQPEGSYRVAKFIDISPDDFPEIPDEEYIFGEEDEDDEPLELSEEWSTEDYEAFGDGDPFDDYADLDSDWYVSVYISSALRWSNKPYRLHASVVRSFVPSEDKGYLLEMEENYALNSDGSDQQFSQIWRVRDADDKEVEPGRGDEERLSLEELAVLGRQKIRAFGVHALTDMFAGDKRIPIVKLMDLAEVLPFCVDPDRTRHTTDQEDS